MSIGTTGPAPAWVGVDTGDPIVDQAFRISLALVDDLRAQYHAAGSPRGWLPVSGGRRGPMVTMSDPRDSAHAVKMAAYLWGEEPDQGEAMAHAMYLLFTDPESGGYYHPCNPADPVAAVTAAMSLRCAADTFLYFPPAANAAAAIARAARTAAWLAATYDPEASGLLDVNNPRGNTFWGAHLGEPNHFPANWDRHAKTVSATMAACVWLQRTAAAARSLDVPAAADLGAHAARLSHALEAHAWSERGAYYYTQRDRIADRWFFSLNGIHEESRETDVSCYYAAEAEGVAPDRRRAVARWIDRALLHDRMFPMPIYYPTHAWYSPDHPNYIDHGPECSVLGGSWDTPYLHAVSLLRETGLTDTLALAVRRRAEAIVRDGDCLEWFYRDGSVDLATGYHRDRYVVCATAQLAATIEGLFGVTPAAPGFAAIGIAPSLPLFRRHRHSAPPAPHQDRANTLRVTLPGGARLELAIRYSERDEILRVRTNRLDRPGHFRLPLDLGARLREVRWDGAPVPHRRERLMDRDFVCLEHALDGGELTVHLDPHPQKGKGTTPFADLRPDGTLILNGCGSREPSPPSF